MWYGPYLIILECIPSLRYIPSKRLVSHLRQSLQWQAENIPKPMSAPFSLLSEYSFNLLLTPSAMHQVYEGHEDEIWDLAYSPNGKYLASASKDGSIYVWDSCTYCILHRFSGHSSAVLRISWSPDSLILVSASEDGSVRIWLVSVMNSSL